MDPETPAAVPPPAEHVAVVEEVGLINRAAEEQLASVSSLNATLAKTILKKEAQTAALQAEHEQLANTNAKLADELRTAQEGVEQLSLKEAQLEDVEKKYNDAAFAAGNAELVVEKRENELDAVRSERVELDDEVSNLRSQIAYLQRKLNAAFEKAEKAKAAREADVQDRSLQVDAILKEKEDEKRMKDNLEQEISHRDQQLDDFSAQVNDAVVGKQRVAEVGDLKVKQAEEQLGGLKVEMDVAAKDVAILTQERDAARAAAIELQDAVAALTGEKTELEKLAAMSGNELLAVKNALLEVQRQKDDSKTQLDAKVTETTALNTDAAKLREQLHELIRRRDTLQDMADTAKNEADGKKSELEMRSMTFATVEKEKDKLVGEKDSLHKDASDARNRHAQLEREKADLEKLISEMEANERDLMATVDALEKEKVRLRAMHEKEVHELSAAKEAQYVRETGEFGHKVDNIMGDRALMHGVEAERQEVAATLVKSEDGEKATPKIVEVNVMPPRTVVDTKVLDDGKNAGGATIPVISPQTPAGVTEAPSATTAPTPTPTPISSSIPTPTPTPVRGTADASDADMNFRDARESFPSGDGVIKPGGPVTSAASNVSDYSSSVSGSHDGRDAMPTPRAAQHVPGGYGAPDAPVIASARMEHFPQATSSKSHKPDGGSKLLNTVMNFFKKGDE